MTTEERLTLLKNRIPENELKAFGDDDSHLKNLLESAKSIIFEVRFPYHTYPEDVEEKYHYLQSAIALELFSKEGAEGEIQHTEGNITRTYSAADVSLSLLSRITPMCG